MAKALIEIIGDAASAVRALEQTSFALGSTATAADTTSASLGEVDSAVGSVGAAFTAMSADVTATTEKMVAASAERIRTYKAEAVAARELAAASAQGSNEQGAALALASRKEAQANRLMGVPAVSGATSAEEDAAAASRNSAERDLSQGIRGGVKGLGGLGGMGFAALAGGTFVGAYAGAAALRSVVAAAQQAQASEALLKQSTEAVGASFQDWRPHIDQSVQSLSDMSGFTKNELNDGLVQLIRSTGNVTDALNLSGLAADIARGRNIDYTTAALLVSKVVNGNVGLLKRYGVEVQSGASSQQALADAQQKFAGAAQAYGQTSAGAFSRFHAAVQGAEEAIGKALLPELTRAASGAANWIDKMEKSGKLEKDVRVATHDMADAFRLLRSTIAPVVSDFGALITKGHQLEAAFKGIHPPSWLGVSDRQTGGVSGLFGHVLGTLVKTSAEGLGALDMRAIHELLGIGSHSGGSRGGPDAAAERRRAEAENSYYRTLYPGRGARGASIDKYTTASLPYPIQRQLAQASTPEEKRAADEAEVAQLTKLLKSGRLSANARVEAEKARSAAEAQIVSIDKTLASNVSKDQLLTQARLDLSLGETAAAQVLLRKDQQRLEAMLSEAKTADERLAIEKQLAAVEKLRHSKSSDFALSPELQMQIARANAIDALNPSSYGPDSQQVRLARQAKAAAEKAIHSHTLTLQGLTEAWQIVGQENAVLAQAKGAIDTYHAVSSKAIVDGVKGLSDVQQMQLRERIAQSEAHRGYAPNQGEGGNHHTHRVHVTVSSNDSHIVKVTQRHHRQSHQRAGGRR